MSVKNMKLTLFELYFTCFVHSGANAEIRFFVFSSSQNFGAIPVLPLVGFFFFFPSKTELERNFAGLYTFVVYCFVTSIVSFTCDKPKPLLTVERC